MRVTNMKGVDLSVFRFDYGLTFTVLLMNADGTIYHTYGGRDSSSADSHLSHATLVTTLGQGMRTHARYQKSPSPPPVRKKETVERIFKGKKPDCYHCHTVDDARFRNSKGKKKRELQLAFPDPVQLGLMVGVGVPVRVDGVVAKSAAERAGIRARDRIATVGGQEVFTYGDLRRALHETANRPAALAVVVERDGRQETLSLKLREDWKRPDPRVFGWRPMKWNLWPRPGFGGRALNDQQKIALGLEREAFAFRVGYLVTWGEFHMTGRRAAKAGIRKGDVIVSVDNKNDFANMDHYHAWLRLERKLGATVTYDVLRKGKRLHVRLKLAKD